jgi:hypothetical protein
MPRLPMAANARDIRRAAGDRLISGLKRSAEGENAVEFVVSAVRAVRGPRYDAAIGSRRAARAAALSPARPHGVCRDRVARVNSGALLARMNAAVRSPREIARCRGGPDRVIPTTSANPHLVDIVNDRAGRHHPCTRRRSSSTNSPISAILFRPARWLSASRWAGRTFRRKDGELMGI